MWLGHAGEEELHHVAVVVGEVGHLPVPQVVVCDRHRAGGASERDLLGSPGPFGGVEIVATRNDAGGTALDRSLFRIS